MIKPTIGRVVLVFFRGATLDTRQPEPALITYVHSDTLINVGGFDANGVPFGITSIELEQEERGTFAQGVMHAEWMPYQKGQAAKNDELEQKLRRVTEQPTSRDDPNKPATTGYVRPAGELTDADVEKEIQAKGLDAPRLHPHDIENAIAGEAYHVFSGKHTVCCLTLRNGYTVLGESSVVSPANFDEALGRKIARDNAKSKIWPLEGYLLRDRIHRAVPNASGG